MNVKLFRTKPLEVLKHDYTLIGPVDTQELLLNVFSNHREVTILTLYQGNRTKGQVVSNIHQIQVVKGNEPVLAKGFAAGFESWGVIFFVVLDPEKPVIYKPTFNAEVS